MEYLNWYKYGKHISSAIDTNYPKSQTPFRAYYAAFKHLTRDIAAEQTLCCQTHLLFTHFHVSILLLSIKAGTNYVLIVPVSLINALEVPYLPLHALPLAGSPLTHIYPLNMTVVSSDPGWWPLIQSFHFYSYFVGSWRFGGMMSVTLLTLNVIL
jgi:hypothetical protein